MTGRLQAILREGRWVQPVSAAGVLGIGAAAFLLSYDALHSLALASGVRPGLARVWPGVLDGFIVVATLTVVAAKRARQPTWYPWALVVLFSAASVAFNILHALDRFLVAARWVAPLVFAMPPVALVLATHLLLQQDAWQRTHTRGSATAEPAALPRDGTGVPGSALSPVAAAASPAGPLPTAHGGAPTSDRLPPPVPAPTAVNPATQGPPGRRQGHADDHMGTIPAVAIGRDGVADGAVREQARRLYAQATVAGRTLTGAELGRAVGKSARYGRLLLAEFRATDPTARTNDSPAPNGGLPP